MCAGLFVLTGVCLLAGAFDDRLFNGVSVWSKPFKFALSLAVYFATCWCSPTTCLTVTFEPRLGEYSWYRLLGSLALRWPTSLFGALGEASHFNATTAFHGLMYSLMGFGAAWLVTALVWFGWAIARNNMYENPIVLAIIIGLALTFIVGGGFGSYLGGQASHWVGAAETDANGILFFNWATDGGDLRVAHFFGMHAMQAIPLFALFLPTRFSL